MTAKDLKNALLQEAVQGKLVPQIASEGNASDLLEEIRKERLSHGFANSYGICDEKNKKSKSSDLRSKSQLRVTKKELPEITEDEIPFDIPENWCWCRIKDLANVSTGMTPLKSESKFYENGNIPWVTSTLTSSDYIDKADTYITEFALNNTSLDLYPKHTLILAMYGQGKTRGQISELLIPATINQACAAIELFSNEETLRKYMKLFHNWNYNNLRKEASGSAQPNLNLNIIQNTIFPLPPLAEQKRIVAAIEKFMPLIEEYGKKETELKALNEQIGALTKKAILQEAVQGKLVPQIAIEGNAKDLLEEIKKEKAKLIKDGKIKKEKPLPEITEEEVPFDIPDSWCWCKVGDLFSTMSGLGYKKDVLSEKSSKMVRVLRGGNILDTSYVFKDDDIMISDKYVKSELYLKKNYLITPAVTSLEHIGKIGYIEKDYDDTVVGGFVLMLLPYYDNDILSKYCLYLFGTRWFRDMCKEITHKSGQAFYNLSREKLLNLVIPIAPLAEQKRIVVAIEKLLPLCEKIGEQQ